MSSLLGNGVSKITFHSAINDYNCVTRKHSPYTLDLKILLKWLKRSYESQATYKHTYIPWKIWFPPSYLAYLASHKLFLIPNWKGWEQYTHSHYIKEGARFYTIVANNRDKLPRTQMQVKWNKPLLGWISSFSRI